MKSGLLTLSVLGFLVVDGRLRVGPPVEPVEPVPRCAAAAETNKATTTTNRVLNRLESRTMATSIESPQGFQIKRHINADPEAVRAWYAFSVSARVKISPKECDGEGCREGRPFQDRSSYCCLAALRLSRRCASFFSASALGAFGFTDR